jgi:hypothetical protein
MRVFLCQDAVTTDALKTGLRSQTATVLQMPIDFFHLRYPILVGSTSRKINEEIFGDVIKSFYLYIVKPYEMKELVTTIKIKKIIPFILEVIISILGIIPILFSLILGYEVFIEIKPMKNEKMEN